MWQIWSGTSLVLQSTDVFTTKCHSICMVDCCFPVLHIDSRQRLRSVRRCLLIVPRHRRSTLVRRTFSVAEPAVSGTCFQSNLETLTALSLHSDSHSKHSFSTSISVFSALEVLRLYAIEIHILLTYVLTTSSKPPEALAS